MDKLKNLTLIQVLRGIASLLVVLYHVSFNFHEIFQRTFIFDFFLFGFSGVDIFFVLSGFIITYTSFNDINVPGRMFSFIKRRFVRIYPTYWIIISLFLLLQILLPSFYKSPYNFDIANVLSTYTLWPYHTMVNGVSWTLSYELFFYLLFSFAFILRKKKLAIGLMAMYMLAIVSIFIFNYDYIGTSKTAGFLFYPMNLEFFMGVLSAIIVIRFRSLPARFLVIAGTILFFAGIFIHNTGLQIVPRTFQRVVIFGIPSFLLITGVSAFELQKKVKVHNLFLSLGDASYSLYLLHLPLVVAGLRILSKLGVQHIAILTMGVIILIICICYFSVLFYKYVEQPVIARLKTRRSIKERPAATIN